MTDEPVPVAAPKIRRILWACTLAVLVFVSFTAGYMVALLRSPASQRTLDRVPAGTVPTGSRRSSNSDTHRSEAAPKTKPCAARVADLLSRHEELRAQTRKQLQRFRDNPENLRAIAKGLATQSSQDRGKLLALVVLLGAPEEREPKLKRIPWNMRVRDFQAVRVLVRALKDEDIDVRNKASLLLVRMVPADVLRAFARDIVNAVKTRTSSHEITLLGKTDSPLAKDLLQSDPRFMRCSEVGTRMALARLGDRKIEQHFIDEFRLCTDPDKKAKLARRLGYIATPGAIVTLARGLRSPEVCSWLGRRARQSVRVPIIMALSDAMPDNPVLWRPDDSAPATDAYYDSVEKWASECFGISWRVKRPPFFFRAPAPF